MKRYMTLFLAVLAILSLTACGKRQNTAVDETPSYDKNPEELICCDGSVTSRFVLTDGLWQWADDPAFPLDQNAVQVLVDALPALQNCKQENAQPDNEALTSYGLKESRRYLDAGGMRFIFGHRNAGGQWYMQVTADPAVYLAPDEIVALTDRSIYSMMVLPTLPVWDASHVLAITLTAQGEVVRTYVNFGEKGWKSGGADVSDTAAVLLNELSALTLGGCADYAPAAGAAAVCGLEPAAAGITVSYSDSVGNEQQLTLSIGNLRSDNCRYCTLDTDPNIYLVAQDGIIALLQAAGLEL